MGQLLAPVVDVFPFEQEKSLKFQTFKDKKKTIFLAFKSNLLKTYFKTQAPLPYLTMGHIVALPYLKN